MKPKRNPLRDATRCVHAGEERHGQAAPLTTPIVQTSVFILPGVEELQRYAEGRSDAYLYTRYGNPTTRAAELKIAALEAGPGADTDCVVTGSGQTASLITALVACQAGDEIVSMLDLYGGTLKLFETVLPRFGIRARFVPYHQLQLIEDFFTPKTRLLFLETPTNPTLRCVDIEGLCRIAQRHKVPVAVDSTFATPILQKPLQLGASFVIHSATKYLGGHSDLTAGAVVANKQRTSEIRKLSIQIGGSPDPFASYLLIRGLKTLEIRVERACRNAAAIAQALNKNKKVVRVMYPGLPQTDGSECARRQMVAPGMVLSIEIKGGGRAAERFIDHLRLWYLAASLGGVESTVSYPVLSSHVGMDQDRLRLLDVSAATVRLSVGIEDTRDLIADLQQALAKA